jgi:hypothetical protein
MGAQYETKMTQSLCYRSAFSPKTKQMLMK